MLRGTRAFALVPLLALGVMGCGEESAEVGEHTGELAFTFNGLTTINGLTSSNGLSSNGLSSNGLSSNGLSSNGLTTVNGLSSNGLSSTIGLMTTGVGRATVQYLVRCALPLGDFLTKQDQTGMTHVFPGQLGLAPAWKNGSCNTSCQQALSACMLAHVNTNGVHIPLWLVSPNTGIGWGLSTQYPNREGTFFGNIFAPNPASGTVNAFYCNGPGFATDVVPGRLGASQMGAPYSDPYFANGGNGDCSRCSSTRSDGPNTCKADGVTFASPITVWRGQTFQAESAVLSGSLPRLTCNPGVCSNGQRVGYIGPHSTVKFNSVFAATGGAHVLIVYYANGDSCANSACVRYFNISVNGGPLQTKTFGVVKAGNWNVIGSAPISLTGFVAGAANTITFTGDLSHSAPDLDWIEVE